VHQYQVEGFNKQLKAGELKKETRLMLPINKMCLKIVGYGIQNKDIAVACRVLPPASVKDAAKFFNHIHSIRMGAVAWPNPYTTQQLGGGSYHWQKNLSGGLVSNRDVG
jgi:hypothetical protein